jgi:2-isopropylmalate synthase
MFRSIIERVPGADKVIFSAHCHNDLGLAVANSLAAVRGGARQIECTINGLGERAGNAALEEVVMALRTRGDALPYDTEIDATHLSRASKIVSAAANFPVQYNKAIVGKNAFAHESGIHQDGMLKNAETFEIMRPADIGLAASSLPLGKHSGRAALRAKLKELGYDLADNQLNDLFVRFKALADRKKEVFDDDLVALVQDQGTHQAHDSLQVKRLRVICGTDGPQEAELTLTIDGIDHAIDATGDGPVDAAFNAVKMLYPHKASLQLYQVSAVTEGTDAQATVSVRIEEDGRIATGSSADTDTIVASVKAYVNALNRLIQRRQKSAPDSDVKTVSFRDAS